MLVDFLGSLFEAATGWHFFRVVAAVISTVELRALSIVAVVSTTGEAMCAFVILVAVTISLCNVFASTVFTIAEGYSMVRLGLLRLFVDLSRNSSRVGALSPLL